VDAFAAQRRVSMPPINSRRRAEFFGIQIIRICELMTRHGFPKRARILRGCDFERVFAARASAADGSLIVYAANSDLGYARLGLAVSRRNGSAVARNRWKRLLREAFRLTQHALPPIDLVCIPRGGVRPDFARVVDALPRLAAQAERKLRPSEPRSSRPRGSTT
jgi:ribonuclease P protein component